MKKKIDVTAAIIVDSDKVLAARRKPGVHLAGYWEFPGGKIKEGETPENCLIRELQEEFSITATIGPFFGESTYEYGSTIVRLMAYVVEHYTGAFKLIDHDDICWLTVEDLHTVEWAPADVPLVDLYQALIRTTRFYADNAEDYCDETIAFDMQGLYRPFQDRLPAGAHILDLGCGSGRDSRIFIEKGYSVTALDGSAEIAACAEKWIGQPVIVAPIQEIQFSHAFEGVWACASLLHCSKGQMRDVLARITQALKDRGVVYMSFKWGDRETVDEKGRYFNNYTEDSLAALLADVTDLSVIDIWSHTMPLRNTEQKWVNALARKERQPN
ncbi:NUDIX domain-containing protein [bacterium]|nr:NUDIX domain-containing protein [bacterium]